MGKLEDELKKFKEAEKHRVQLAVAGMGMKAGLDYMMGYSDALKYAHAVARVREVSLRTSNRN